jgi:hypothetical protein
MLRKRAEREVGRLIAQMPKAKADRHPKNRGSGNPNFSTLAEAGVDKMRTRPHPGETLRPLTR